MPVNPGRPCSYPDCPNVIRQGRYCQAHMQGRPHPCGNPGCPEIVQGSYLCARHQAEQEQQYDQERGSAASRGYDSHWRIIRRMYLRRHPVCVDPFGQHARLHQVIPATEVDHILPKSSGGNNHDDNLQGLCKSCHTRKTNEEKKANNVGTRQLIGVER